MTPQYPAQVTRRRLVMGLALAPAMMPRLAQAGLATYDFSIVRGYSLSRHLTHLPFILGQDGAFYGMGSGLGMPALHRITLDGSVTALAEFFGASQSSDGLVQGADGTLYGVASRSGANRQGLLFRIQPDGTDYAVLRDFRLGSLGSNPCNPPAFGPFGKLYGATISGGNYGQGVFYRVGTDGSGYTVIHHVRDDGTDGFRPGGLTLAGDGRFYGIASRGGAGGFGTIFRLSIDGTVDNLHAFDSIGGSYVNRVALHPNGELYATATRGRWGDITQPRGAAYQISTSGAVTQLVLFKAQHGGFFPCSPIQVGMDGQLYGTTEKGGAHGVGSVYKLNVQGNLRAIHSFEFSRTNGTGSYAGVVLGPDGDLYGLADGGGPDGWGIFYRLHKTRA